MTSAIPTTGALPAHRPVASAPPQGAWGADVGRTAGQIVHIAEIARDVIELVIQPDAPPAWLPGQFLKLGFRGYPARPFSPTGALGRIAGDGKLRLNVKRVRDGRVTPHLGRAIRTGHEVAIEGPYGEPATAPLEGGGRLVLVGSETGFAPVWSMACAALRVRADREIVLVAAARTLEAFYMTPALSLASRYPNVSIVATVDELSTPWRGLLPGLPLAHLPLLTSGDTVYGAGEPDLIAALADAAASAGAAFCSDPYCPVSPRGGWIGSARSWLKAG